MEKIIVVGYPKSGNTWVTRLTAELISCPAKGFLYDQSNSEISIEGLDRSSNYECYKSHHQYTELLASDRKKAKIIYVMRDPRDIVLSGESYFYNLDPFKIDYAKSQKHQYSVYLLNRIYKRLIGAGIMRKRLMHAVLHGDLKVNNWCRISWKKHLDSYSKVQGILVVKYEDLMKNPFKESKRILDFMGLEKDDDYIRRSIENQSFNRVKQKFRSRQQLNQTRFLRKGSTEQWKTGLSKKEKRLFLQNIKEELQTLGYDL